MLFTNNDYEHSKDDFNEINNSLENGNFFDASKSENIAKIKGKLPKLDKFLLFLIGFAYTGMLLISFVYSLLLSAFVIDKNFFNVLANSLCYGTLLIIFGYFIFKNREYFLAEAKQKENYLYGFLLGIVIVGIEIVISYLMISLLGKQEMNANQEGIEILMKSYPTLMILIAVIIGPFCEEITYRVGLYGCLAEYNEKLGFIISGLIFGFVHIKFTNTTFLAELSSFPVYVAIGMCLNYCYKKHGLACSYVAHAILNLMSVIGVFLR